MASKIFMDDMPELTEKILNNLNNDFYSLYSPEIFYSLGRNDLFFSRLQDLSLGPIPDSTENVIVLLKILAKNATKISALKLEEFYCDYEPQLLYALICIIESQEQLQQFSLVGGEGFTIEFHSIISALESQKNSLQKVVIECCAFTTEFKVLSDCKNLEYFHVRYCGDVKIFETSLNTLEITDCSVTTSNIIQILQKSGSLLQRLKLESTYEVYLKKSLLLEALKSFCPNITYLDIPCIILSTQLVELIGDLQKLQFLTLWHINCIPEDPKIGVLKFAKVLPSTLQYLDLRYSCLNSYIDILLNNCNAPLKNLLINHINNEKTTKTLVEFCIRKRSLNYVGVEEYLNLDDSIIKKLEGYVTLMPCECIVVNC
ncbi:hypothetical protein F8M41_012272 [Gigaspora margarita]|uniref:Uncharacterized protein n=1 Tax=Gigaspora margarita TaxID=4874 RepID=A0A8H4B3Y0_GIGMA|nr:hypothetical protein F8M41_012272 [Gigaspora margarita]